MGNDILLLNTPKTFAALPPLGIMYICSYVREKFKTELVDAAVLNYSKEQIRSLIEKEKPAILGIAMFTPTYAQAMEVLEIAKSIDPSIVTVVGGPHPTVVPDTVQKTCIDYIIRGEGEHATHELADFVLNGKGNPKDIKGISFKQNGTVRHNPPREFIKDLDSLPWPARDKVPIEKYKGTLMCRNHPETQVMGSRGCPFKCAFCSTSNVFGRSLRFRDPIDVVDEIEFLVEKYKIKSLFFHDDGLNYKKDWLETVCNELIERRLNEKIEWKGQVRVNKGFVSLELLRKMKKAGCWLLCWGIESGNQKVLDTVHKSITLQEVRDAVSLSSKAGIKNLGFFMGGNMGENKQTVQDTIRFSKELAEKGLDYLQWSLAVPYPGTEFYEVCKKNGWLKTDKWEDWVEDKRSAIIEMPDMPQNWLEQTTRKAYTSFYFNPKYIFNQLKKVKSKDDAKMLFYGMRWVMGAIGHSLGKGL